MDARNVSAMLRRHYLPENRPASGLFVEEIEAPDGRRRADALWVPLTASGGHEIIGHEIKVSRADVAAELADLTKADSWMRYCTRWWLTVSEPALVEGFEIPETWGVMAPPSGRKRRSMTVVREAPRLYPLDPARAYRRVLAKNHFATNDQVAQLKSQLDHAERRDERLQAQIEQLRLTGANDYQTPTTKLVLEVVRLLASASHDWSAGAFRLGEDVTARDIADALTDLARLRGVADEMRSQVRRTVDDLRRAADPVGIVAREIEKVMQQKGAV
jgi:hypothetical protein